MAAFVVLKLKLIWQLLSVWDLCITTTAEICKSSIGHRDFCSEGKEICINFWDAAYMYLFWSEIILFLV